MISTYLHLFFSNCKSLQKTSNYNESLLLKGFSEDISHLLIRQNLATEEDLFFRLTTSSYTELKQFLDENLLIKIFYLVNSLGEYNIKKENIDELGRFKYLDSVQSKIDITENLVWKLIVSSLSKYDFLRMAYTINDLKSYFFLSHDIDSLFGSTLQDGSWALKNKRFDVLFKIFTSVLIAKPAWFNIDLIMKLESEYDFKSTFYWLVNKGKIDARQTNSDYSISSAKVQNQLKKVEKNGFENGLHKSISKDSFQTEISKLKSISHGNRYHYLKFQLPHAYHEIENSGLQLDASLGFAEHYGFRNSYGYPFCPYNHKTKGHHSFIEVPLTIMDGTFQRYLKIPVHKTADTIISFIEKNKENSLLSVLWHNTFFTNYKYKGYKEEYIKLLQYFYEEKYVNINQSEIIDLFLWKK
jgi:hypothetical protein